MSVQINAATAFLESKYAEVKPRVREICNNSDLEKILELHDLKEDLSIRNTLTASFVESEMALENVLHSLGSWAVHCLDYSKSSLFDFAELLQSSPSNNSNYDAILDICIKKGKEIKLRFQLISEKMSDLQEKTGKLFVQLTKMWQDSKNKLIAEESNLNSAKIEFNSSQERLKNSKVETSKTRKEWRKKTAECTEISKKAERSSKISNFPLFILGRHTSEQRNQRAIRENEHLKLSKDELNSARERLRENTEKLQESKDKADILQQQKATTEKIVEEYTKMTSLSQKIKRQLADISFRFEIIEQEIVDKISDSVDIKSIRPISNASFQRELQSTFVSWIALYKIARKISESFISNNQRQVS